MSTKTWFLGRLPSTPAEITFGQNKDVNSWIKFRLYNTSFCASKKLVPWERTPWHWSKHVKFTPSGIMNVPHRLCLFAHLSNCNLATCWHIEFSILSLPHLSISIHLRIRFGCSMKLFELKITLGLALGESWPLLAQPQKNTDVYKGMLPWEGFPRQTCKNYLRRKQGCKLMDQI